MRIILVLIFLLLPIQTYAGYFSFVRGGVTTHFENPQGDLCHEYKNSGIIYNQTHMYRVFGQRFGISYLDGENSICKPISGFTGSFRIYRGYTFEMIGTLGYYKFDLDDWGNGTPGFYWKIADDLTIIPIVGLEFNFVLVRWWRLLIKNINLITPKISHHAVALEFMF